jgi:RNA polymerase sigma factor (sigma-70 family)
VENNSSVDKKASVQRLTTAFQQYRKAVAKLVARIVRPYDIEDIVQETYVRIYQASQKQTIFHPKSFMLRTARNLAMNYVSRADAMNHLADAQNYPPTTQVDGEGDPEADVLDYEGIACESLETQAQGEEEFLLLCRAIRELPLQCRRAFILRKVYGVSQREAAKQLGISESTVEKHVAKGIVSSCAYMKLHGYTRASAEPKFRRNLATGSSDE